MSGRFRAFYLASLAAVGSFALPVCAAENAAPAVESGRAVPKSAPPLLSVAPAKTPPLADTNRRSDRKNITRRPEESLEQLGARVIPPGAHTITSPLELELPPLGQVVLVLYELDSDDLKALADPSIYRGIVLVPDGQPKDYRMEALPSQPNGFGTLMYDVKSVFAADADGDGAPELCILSDITEVGAGDSGRPHTDTDIFKWSRSGFTLMPQSDRRPLYNLRDAKAVRARLKKLRIR